MKAITELKNQVAEMSIDIAEKIKDKELKLEMIVCYGCLIETYNESVRELNKEKA